MQEAKYSDQKGVSLVELSVAVAIIGILLAGTLGGANLLKSSKLRRVATEFAGYERIFNQFEQEYHYLPGDFPRAFEFWDSACGTNDAGDAGSCNGDGNGVIGRGAGAAGAPQEDLIAWEHLALSGIAQGSYTGVNFDGTTRYQIGTNAPGSKAFTSAIYAILQVETLWYNTAGITIHSGALDGDGLPWTGVMSAKDARSIDVKMDDGKAAYGTLYATRASTGCVDADATAATATFALGNSTKDCRLTYWLKKN